MWLVENSMCPHKHASTARPAKDPPRSLIYELSPPSIRILTRLGIWEHRRRRRTPYWYRLRCSTRVRIFYCRRFPIGRRYFLAADVQRRARGKSCCRDWIVRLYLRY